MPTYEYACRACGEGLEVVQSFSDAALTGCPSCGGELRKVFSSIGISFKGTGFYKNDSRATSPSTRPAEIKGPTETTTPSGGAEPAKSEPKATPATPSSTGSSS